MQALESNGVAPVSAAPPIDEHFNHAVLPHFAAAHRLARWILRNDDDADDAVQEASLRALRYFHTFTGGNGRTWFLRIVRNVCWNWHKRMPLVTDAFDEEQHSSPPMSSDPELRLMQMDDVTLVGRAMTSLPDRFRELLNLRELEGLSYRELAAATGVPIGSVMSGLSRARQAFRSAVRDESRRTCGTRQN